MVCWIFIVAWWYWFVVVVIIVVSFCCAVPTFISSFTCHLCNFSLILLLSFSCVVCFCCPLPRFYVFYRFIVCLLVCIILFCVCSSVWDMYKSIFGSGVSFLCCACSFGPHLSLLTNWLMPSCQHVWELVFLNLFSSHFLSLHILDFVIIKVALRKSLIYDKIIE